MYFLSFLIPIDAIKSCQGGHTQHGISKDINDHMRDKPDTLQRRHQRFIHRIRVCVSEPNKNDSHYRRIAKHPFLPIEQEDCIAYEPHKKGVPYTCLRQGTQGRAFQVLPQENNKASYNHRSHQMTNDSQAPEGFALAVNKSSC